MVPIGSENRAIGVASAAERNRSVPKLGFGDLGDGFDRTMRPPTFTITWGGLCVGKMVDKPPVLKEKPPFALMVALPLAFKRVNSLYSKR